MFAQKSNCGNIFGAFRIKRDGITQYTVAPLVCHSWLCPACRKEKANSVGTKIQRFFNGRKVWMYTLTFQHSLPPREQWLAAARSWNNLRTSLVKGCGSFNYIRILETHRTSPYPHYHILIDRDIDMKTLSRLARLAGFGWVMDKRPVDDAGCGVYLAKYLKKAWPRADSEKIRAELRLRLYTASRGVIAKKMKSSGWEYLNTTPTHEHGESYVEEQIDWDYGCRCKRKMERVASGVTHWYVTQPEDSEQRKRTEEYFRQLFASASVAPPAAGAPPRPPSLASPPSVVGGFSV